MNRVIFIILLTTSYTLAQNSRTIDSLQKVLKTDIIQQKKVDVYNKMAEEYRFSDSLKVAAYTQKAIQIAKKINYPKGIADAYYFIGWITMEKGHYLGADKLFKKVLRIAQKSNYSRGKTNAYNGLGINSRRIVFCSQALEYLFKALRIDQKLNDSLGMARRYDNIASTMKTQGDYASSLEYSQKALSISRKIKNNEGMSVGYFDIGEIYKVQGKYVQAIRYHQKSLEISKTVENGYMQARNFLELGTIYCALKKYEKAFEYQKKSLDIFVKLKQQPYVAYACIGLGKTYTATQKYTKALEFLQKGYQVAQKTDRVDYSKDGAEALAIAYEKSGNDKKALEYYKLFLKIDNKLNKRETVKKLARLEQQNKLKKAKAKAREKENIYQRIVMVLLLAGVISFFCFWFLQRKNNRKLQANSYLLKNHTKALEDSLAETDKQKEKIGLQNQEIQAMNVALQETLQKSETQQLEIQATNAKLTRSLEISKMQTRQMRIAHEEKTTANFALNKLLEKSRTQEEKIREQNEEIQSINTTLEEALQKSKTQQLEIQAANVKLTRSLEISKMQTRQMRIAHEEKTTANFALNESLETSRKQEEKIREQNEEIQSINATLEEALQKSKIQQFEIQAANTKLTRSLEISKMQKRLMRIAHEEIRTVNVALNKSLKTSKKQQYKIRLQNHKIEEAYQNTRLLANIGQQITSSLCLEDVLSVTHTHMQQFMDVTNLAIGSYNAEKQTIEYHSVIIDSSMRSSYSLAIKNHNHPVTWCIKNQRPMRLGEMSKEIYQYIEDFEAETYLEHTSLKALPCSAMYMPLVVNNQLMGVITVQSDKRKAYTDQHFNLFKTLSTYVAIAHENACIHQQIEEKNQQLRELGDFKQEMVQMIAHDLKNPLNNIRGLSDEATKGTPMHQVHQASLHMEHLIINMLDTQKMEEARLRPKETILDVTVLLSKTIGQVKAIAHAKNIEIIQQTSGLSVLADGDLTRRILVNLLNNAVKYSAINQKVVVKTEVTNHHFVRFSITDSGKGIPKEALNKVFDKFYTIQSKKTETHQYSTGIGLTFCKLAAEAQGGEAGVESVLGQGSTFWFTLPLAAMQAATRAGAAKAPKETKEARFVGANLLLSQHDKEQLKPWIAKLSQYQVYQLSKIKAILQQMNFRENSVLAAWKQKVEEALYNSNEEVYNALIA